MLGLRILANIWGVFDRVVFIEPLLLFAAPLSKSKLADQKAKWTKKKWESEAQQTHTFHLVVV